jgi:excisionase family DNA binding protein
LTKIEQTTLQCNKSQAITRKFEIDLKPCWKESGAGGTMTKPNDNEARKDSEVMTIKDVAQYLRLSEAKVYELARARAIPALRIGKSWRFQKDLLQQWLRRNAAANMDGSDKGD